MEEVASAVLTDTTDLASYVFFGSLGWMFVGLILAFFIGEILFGTFRKILANRNK